MKLLRPLYLFLIFPGLMLSCNSVRTKNAENPDLPKAGVIHEKIISKADHSRTYALYIPGGQANKRSGGQAEKQTSWVQLLPCIIAFDPHGDGSLPVTRYQKLADTYGYMLIGSNNIKNGLPPAEIDEIVAGLFTEVKTVYPVDTARIYLMGFSGGARIASLSAFYKIPVKGVVGCGAGIAGASGAPVYKVDYFGLAGMEDFNMNEIMELDYPLSQAGMRHVISTFDGIHEWPPEDVMEEAFQWFTFNAMKDGAIPKDSGFIASVMNGFTEKTTTLQNRGLILEAAETCRKAISFGDGLESTDGLKVQLSEIENRLEYAEQVAYRKKVMESEEKERRELMDALSSKELAWWKTRITNYEGRRTKDEGRKTREEEFMNSRLLAFLRLLCYMNATSVLTSQNEVAAEKIVTIYEIADPDNPEAYYLHAVLLARKPGSKGAIEKLGTAVDKGFSDKLRIMEQPEFASLKELPEFHDLLKKVK